MIAIYNGQITNDIDLIENGANLNFETPGIKTTWKLTALEVAIRKDISDAVKALLQTNKIIHPEEYIMTASGQKNPKTIDLLISYGANPNYSLKNGYSVHDLAASFGYSMMFLNAFLNMVLIM